MSVELISVLIAVLAVGAALGGLILTGNRGLRQDMAQLETRLDERIGRLESQIGELRERMAYSRVTARVLRKKHFLGKPEWLTTYRLPLGAWASRDVLRSSMRPWGSDCLSVAGSSYLGTSWRPLIRLTRCSGALVGPDNQVRSEGFFGACNLKLNG